MATTSFQHEPCQYGEVFAHEIGARVFRRSCRWQINQCSLLLQTTNITSKLKEVPALYLLTHPYSDPIILRLDDIMVVIECWYNEHGNVLFQSLRHHLDNECFNQIHFSFRQNHNKIVLNFMHLQIIKTLISGSLLQYYVKIWFISSIEFVCEKLRVHCVTPVVNSLA